MNPTAAAEGRRTPGPGADGSGPDEHQARVAAALERLPPRLREAVEPHAERLGVAAIADAYEFAEEAHRGQKRAS
ncbi:MAG: hypothetical protein P8177_09650, partial [Gemmatimonadota bacterium]